MKTLECRINNFAMARTEDTGKILINDHEYIQLTEESISIMKEIREYLPDEKVKLLNKLDDCWGELTALSEGVMYKQGFKDGFKLKETLVNI